MQKAWKLFWPETFFDISVKPEILFGGMEAISPSWGPQGNGPPEGGSQQIHTQS